MTKNWVLRMPYAYEASIAGPEGGNQKLLDVGCEADAIDRPIEQARSSNAA